VSSRSWGRRGGAPPNFGDGELREAERVVPERAEEMRMAAERGDSAAFRRRGRRGGRGCEEGGRVVDGQERGDRVALEGVAEGRDAAVVQRVEPARRRQRHPQPREALVEHPIAAGATTK
jgi:hypothetical protein